MTGTTISHYSILEKLGEGGMGVIYKALDERLNRLVALKFLPRDKAPDPEHRRRFALEARAVSALNHPNIVTIHDIASEGGCDFIVMEYVAGKTLDELIPPRGMRLEETLRLATQIAAALAAAHGAGVIHRDLKPRNVMVTPEGLVKVLDFGLAKLAASEDSAVHEPGKSRILGTACYMSPEQAEGKPLDTRSDIFSFGSVVYEMVTGRRAFDGESIVSVLAAILNATPPPVTATGAGMPSELDRIVARCLSKDPADRWQTMAGVRLALEELQAGPKEGSSRRHVLRDAAAAVAACAVFLAIFLLSRSGGDAPERIVPLTSAAGTEWQPTFSPDGNQLAYSAFGPRGPLDSHISVLYIGAGAPLQLTNPRGSDVDISPAWSPDGRWIAFNRLHPETGRADVLIVSPLGGPERKITDISIGTAAPFGGESMGWTPDSKWLAMADKPSQGAPAAIFLVNVETGGRRQMTKPETPAVGDANPAVAPDGRSLVFTRSLTSVSGELHWLRLTSSLEPEGEPRQITHLNLYSFSPAFTPDGGTVLFSAGHLGTASVYAIDLPNLFRRESAPRRIASGQEGMTCALAAHVKGARSRLAFSKIQLDANIWQVRLDSATRNGERQQAPLIATTRHEYNARISPDGKRIAFESNRGGNPEIWVSDIDGSNALPVTSYNGSHAGTPRWSPDGRFIVYDSVVSGQANIYVVPANGGAPRRITADAAQDVIPSWSHDGKWIYYASNRSRTWQIWKVAADGAAPGNPIQITTGGGTCALESPDGKDLYFAKERTGAALWRMPLAGGREVKVLDGMDDCLSYDVMPDGIYYTGRTETPETLIRFHSFATGTDLTISRADASAFIGLSVSPDRRSLIYSRLEKAGGDIYMVDNYR